MQHRATKLVSEIKDLRDEDRLEALNLPTLEYRRKRGELIQMFKLIHGIEDFDISKLVSFNDNTTRGHTLKLNKLRCLKSLWLNAFPSRCIDNWNKLPNDLVCSKSVDQAWGTCTHTYSSTIFSVLSSECTQYLAKITSTFTQVLKQKAKYHEYFMSTAEYYLILKLFHSMETYTKVVHLKLNSF